MPDQDHLMPNATKGTDGSVFITELRSDGAVAGYMSITVDCKYTVPPDVVELEVIAIGGGGGAGLTRGGGAGHSTPSTRIAVQPGWVFRATIGAGGQSATAASPAHPQQEQGND